MALYAFGNDDYHRLTDDPNQDPGTPPGGEPGGATPPAPGGFQYTFPLNGGGGGGGGGGEGGGSGLGARPTFNWPALPGFTPPKWKPPTMEDAQNEPGYQFRMNSGQDALERSAAAKGVLRTGGTLKDVIEYGQNFGANEYQNVFNRAYQGYGLDYKAAYDKYAPLLAQWNMQAGAERAAGLAAYDRDWQQYMFNHRGGGGGGFSALQQWMQEEPPAP